MTSELKPLRCYIGVSDKRSNDLFLIKNGFSTSLVLFAVPTLGILFRCRVAGRSLDLEFGAFFALLKYVQSTIKLDGINSLQVLSSNAEFVFSFTGHSEHLKKGSERLKLLEEHSRKLKIAVGLVERHKNRVFLATDEFPLWPSGRPSPVRQPSTATPTKIKPFQKGLEL